MTTCTRCDGTGFLNLDQLGPLDVDDVNDRDAVLLWISENDQHDVQVCDCCGDGYGWYGEPGQHYGPDDPKGDHGPYASNGGLCRCH